ncbi:6-O-methylguanine DNA methyltransferase [Colletotrichum acutatum]
MARTEEAEAFFHAVYTAVQEIPVGKVTTYGHIARLVGTRESFPHSAPPLTPSHYPEPHRTQHPASTTKTSHGSASSTPKEPFRHGTSTSLPTPTPHFRTITLTLTYVHNASNITSPISSQPSGARNQAESLQAEDVEVSRTAMGEFQVDFSSYGWFPDVLPSEEE